MFKLLRFVISGFALSSIAASTAGAATRDCSISPLGNGQDDTDQVSLLFKLTRVEVLIHT